MSSYNSQVSIAVKYFINSNLLIQLTFNKKTFWLTSMPQMFPSRSWTDEIYISDQKSLDIPSSLYKRTQTSASEVFWDDSKVLKSL